MIEALHQLACIARAGAPKYAHVRHASKSRWSGRERALVHHGEASTQLALPWARPAEIKMPFTALLLILLKCLTRSSIAIGVVQGCHIEAKHRTPLF